MHAAKAISEIPRIKAARFFLLDGCSRMAFLFRRHKTKKRLELALQSFYSFAGGVNINLKTPLMSIVFGYSLSCLKRLIKGPSNYGFFAHR